jgi:hypothetical protein
MNWDICTLQLVYWGDKAEIFGILKLKIRRGGNKMRAFFTVQISQISGDISQLLQSH